MKVVLKNKASAGTIDIGKGEYMVVALPEKSMIQLSGAGVDIEIPAVKRPGKVKVRSTTISFFSMGGKNWTLSVAIPNRGEWVSFLVMKSSED